MAGVKLSLPHEGGVGLHAHGKHELNGVIDALGKVHVSLALAAVLHEVKVPLHDTRETSITTITETTKKIQGRGRLIVSANKTPGVGNASLSGEFRAVNDITTVRGEFDATDFLSVGRTGLGELTSNPPELYNGDTTTERANYRHLKQKPVKIPNSIGGKLAESFSAIASEEDESVACRSFGNTALESTAFTGENQRRHTLNFLKSLLLLRHVDILGLLSSGKLAPSRRGPRAVSTVANTRDLNLASLFNNTGRNRLARLRGLSKRERF
mmetsp:Transcript_34982/g.62892  ORF Transcript_34982/g.62892 Transcript_34982/m.62892 type:complete len:269 (-) Transcript_34982:144-950(-)